MKFCRFRSAGHYLAGDAVVLPLGQYVAVNQFCRVLVRPGGDDSIRRRSSDSWQSFQLIFRCAVNIQRAFGAQSFKNSLRHCLGISRGSRSSIRCILANCVWASAGRRTATDRHQYANCWYHNPFHARLDAVPVYLLPEILNELRLYVAVIHRRQGYKASFGVFDSRLR